MALVPAVLAVGFVACSTTEAEPEASPTSEPTPTATASATATAAPSPTTTPTPFAGAVARFEIPKFGVESGIEVLGLLPTNQLDSPKDPLKTGWYEEYGRPGWEGNTVFSAHVDYYPDIEGPFYRLAELEVGDTVAVVMANGDRYVYEVFSNVRYHVDDIPMGQVLWPDHRPNGEQWITLITCGGDFVPYRGDSGPGRYLHRDVVVARRIE